MASNVLSNAYSVGILSNEGQRSNLSVSIVVQDRRRLTRNRDVLKRHWQTCKLRLEQDQEIPRLVPKIKGKKRKACDRCARLKKACSLGYPCESCREKMVACTFNPVARGSANYEEDDTGAVSSNCGNSSSDNGQREEQHGGQIDNPFEMDELNAGFGSESLSWEAEETEGNEGGSQLLHSPAVHVWTSLRPASPSDFDIITLNRFPFLSKFTKGNGFLDSFECGSHNERQAIAREASERHRHPGNQFTDNRGAPLDPFAGLDIDQAIGSGWDSLLDPTTTASQQLYFLGRECNALQPTYVPGLGLDPFETNSTGELLDVSSRGASSSSVWISDELALKTCEIVDQIKAITWNKPRGSKITISWSPLLEQMCFDFFSPPNLRKFLELFWSSWYPNSPIIHRPTFNDAQCPCSLLLSMVLIGACMSPDSRDHAGANIWFNSLEEMIFSCDELFSEADPGDNWLERPAVRRRFELLQAAYFVCLLQNWEGSEESKRRIRRHRYSTVIAVSTWPESSSPVSFLLSFRH